MDGYEIRDWMNRYITLYYLWFSCWQKVLDFYFKCIHSHLKYTLSEISLHFSVFGCEFVSRDVVDDAQSLARYFRFPISENRMTANSFTDKPHDTKRYSQQCDERPFFKSIVTSKSPPNPHLIELSPPQWSSISMVSTNEPDLGRPATSIPVQVSESEDIENILIQTSTSPMPQSTPENERNGMSRSQAYNLYTSHFLSTWNVRTYEFAAVSS